MVGLICCFMGLCSMCSRFFRELENYILHGTLVLVWNARKCQYFFLNFLKIWRGRGSCGTSRAARVSPRLGSHAAATIPLLQRQACGCNLCLRRRHACRHSDLAGDTPATTE